ncbi:MAG: NAD(P)-dependent oxidoreductase [Alphaproteobacteria bacterium]|nr:NAD(P)-dependent oxidoreductase [Alphaproteobacteria bacterium SS10]
MGGKNVAFVGLGVMGHPMAGYLTKAGHNVAVYNRTTAKAEAWAKEYGGRAAMTPKEAAEGAEIVFTCVGNDDDVRSVVHGENGVLAGLASGGLLVDHTTASAGLARELDEVAKGQGVGFLDAPVSGGQAGAENGVLTVMVGGTDADFGRGEPVMDAYSRNVTHIGPAGHGQMAKMCNQMCIAGILQGLSEAINFGQRAGIDMNKVIETISKGAAQSWQMENRAETMIQGEFDFGFAVDWMRKDLAICLEEADRVGARVPVTALVDQFYAHVQARQGGRWDTSSLIQLLAND